MKYASWGFTGVMLVSLLGLWGCAQNQSGVYHTRLRELEARHAKLEEDYRMVVLQGEQTRKKLAQLETQRSELALQVEELKGVVQERDELRKTLAVRTGERDALQNNLVQFGKELQDLVGRIEVATQTSFRPAASILPASLRRTN